MSRLRAVFCLLLLTASLCLSPRPTLAQVNSGLAVSPPSFELSANPGDTLKNAIRVDNLNQLPEEVSISLRNFTALGEEGQVNLTEEGESTYSLASWITVEPEKIIIPARESKTFEYTINVPANAEPGGRFGSIVFKTAAKPVTGQTGVAVGQEIGALIFVKVAGDITEKATIASFDTNKKFYEYGPINFDIRMKNEGNVFFRPTGTITITDWRGKKLKDLPVDTRNVLPGAIRKMSSKLGNKWLIGRYTATTTLVYGSKSKFTTASTTFWVVPYKLLLLGLVLVGGMGFVLIRGRRRIKGAIKALQGK